MKIISLFGIFVVLLIGAITPVMAEERVNIDTNSENKLEEKIRQIEQMYKDKLFELEQEYQDKKVFIYESTENNSELSEDDIDAMWEELFIEYEEKRKNLELERIKEIESVENAYFISDDIQEADYTQLKNKISELEEENRILKQTIAELEEKITKINAVLMEQVRFIYQWVLNR